MSRKLTTNAGCPVADNQNVMTAGRRGPQLLLVRAAPPMPSATSAASP